MDFNRYNIGDISTQGSNSSIVILQGVTFNVDTAEGKEAFLKAFKSFIDRDAYLKESFPKIFGQLDDMSCDIKEMLKLTRSISSDAILLDELKHNLKEALEARERAEKALEELKNQFKDELEVHKLIEQAEEIFSRGNIEAFDNIMEAAIQLKEKLNKISTGKMYHAKAQAWMSRFDYRKVYENLKNAVEYDAQDIQYLLLLSSYQLKLAKYDDALKTIELVIDIAKRKNDYSALASAYNNLGGTHSYKGDYDNAMYFYEMALNIYKKIFGDETSEVATAYNNLAGIYYQKNNHTMVKEYLEKSFNIYLKVFELEHPNVAIAYNNKATGFQMIYDYENAMIYYRKALEIRLKIFHHNHPDIAHSYNNIASIYKEQELYNEALCYIHKALEIFLFSLGDNHPYTALVYYNLGALYNTIEKHEDAIFYSKKSLDIRLINIGQAHIDTIKSYMILGKIYDDMQNYGASIEYYNYSISGILKTPIKDYQNIAECYNSLAMVYYKKREFQSAESYLKKAYDIYVSTLGTEHSETKNIQTGLELVSHLLSST